MSDLTTGARVTLSRDFTLSELCRTDTGLRNEPSTDRQLASLVLLATRILQPIRNQFGPIAITSGFRSPEVNAAVGGSATSQHPLGEAADLRAERSTTHEVFLWLVKQAGLPIGQVIHERPAVGRAWVHVSLPRKGKPREHLVWNGAQYLPWTGGAL
jgi:hypothetical protein